MATKTAAWSPVTLSTSPTIAWIAGLTACFTGLANVTASPPVRNADRYRAVRRRTPVASSIGNRIRTARTLKKSCTLAAANARRNSSFRVMCPSDTMAQVTVVPMLAPMMMGTAFSIDSMPAATNPTTVEVVMDELWTMLVARIPMKRPTSGLDVVAIRRSEKPAPNISNPVPSNLTLTRNT